MSKKKNIFTTLINKLNFFKKKNDSKDLKNIKNKEISSKKNKLHLNKKDLKKNNTQKSVLIQKKEIDSNSLLFFLKKKFTTVRKSFFSVIENFFSENKINKKFLRKLEDKLISFDIGTHTAKKIINKSVNSLKKKDFQDTRIVYKKIFFYMNKILKKSESSFSKVSLSSKYPYTILVVGVNGSGKTTTIAKLAKLYKDQNKKVLVAAADTFRAAAIDQLDILCKKNKIPIISKKHGSDPASVVYEAFQQAISKNFDILIIDTAGRFHTKINLMNELKKIVSVIKKLNQNNFIDIFLTIDSCTGQNSLVQTKFFNKSLKITGIVLTKFDGTSKGGIIFSISDNFSIPVKYITTGESIKDICIFNNLDFMNSIFKSK